VDAVDCARKEGKKSAFIPMVMTGESANFGSQKVGEEQTPIEDFWLGITIYEKASVGALMPKLRGVVG